ncbi:hypothetical protein ABZZ17_12135 [Streptomyces sp. NPDC006512]|uniref:hypothetical protein n=1 Tax=Streptomyces sp. NPDC006512 TaxID=3154307 RepID=UPI0033B14954
MEDFYAHSPEEKDLDLALGFMVRNSAATEFALFQTMERMVAGPFASVVAARASGPDALDTVKQILDTGAYDAEASRELREVLDDCVAAFRKRNRHIYGLRKPAGEAAVAVQDPANDRPQEGSSAYESLPEELVQLGVDLSELAVTLLKWSDEHVEARS